MADTRAMAEEPGDPDFGTAGAGARREYERRKARREARTRREHPCIGGLLLRLQAPPQSETAWKTGASGEEALAAHLSSRCPDTLVLHDRRMPGWRANIDHIAVSRSGVLVVDAKCHKGKIEVRRPFFGDAKLVIRGRDQTKLVEGLRRQVDAVRGGLATLGQDVPVAGCFCFINPDGQPGGSGIPLFRTLTVDEFPLYYPRKLAKRLNRKGPLDGERIAVLAEALVERFPPA